MGYPESLWRYQVHSQSCRRHLIGSHVAIDLVKMEEAVAATVTSGEDGAASCRCAVAGVVISAAALPGMTQMRFAPYLEEAKRALRYQQRAPS